MVQRASREGQRHGRHRRGRSRERPGTLGAVSLSKFLPDRRPSPGMSPFSFNWRIARTSGQTGIVTRLNLSWSSAFDLFRNGPAVHAYCLETARLPWSARSMMPRAAFMSRSMKRPPSETVPAPPGRWSTKPSHECVLLYQASSLAMTSRVPCLRRIQASFCQNRKWARPSIKRTVFVPVLRSGVALISFVAKDAPGARTGDACRFWNLRRFVVLRCVQLPCAIPARR